MARHRPSRRRRALILVLALVLLGGAFGAFQLVRKDEGRERRERAMQAGRALEEGRLEDAKVLLRGLVADDPGNAGLRHNLAVALFGLEQLGAAESVVRETLRIEPDHLPSHTLLGRLLQRTGRLPEAIREARIVAELTRGSSPSQYRLAELLLDAGRRTEALAVLTDAAGRADADEGLTVRLAGLLEQLDPDSAVAVRARQYLDGVLRGAREELSRGTPEPERVVRFADLALGAGRPEEAMLALTAIPVHRELTRPEKLRLARACSGAGRHRRAMEILEELGVDPDPADAARPDVALARAAVYLDSDEPGRALDSLAPAISAYPDDVGLLLLRLLALRRQYFTQGEALVDGATLEEAATRLLLLRPDEEEALKIRAAVRLHRGLHQEALADATALRRLAPHSPYGAWLAGVALLELGHDLSAVTLLEEGLRAAEDPDSATATLLRAAIRAGDREVARTALEALPAGFPALRAAAALVTGDEERAVSLATTPEFASEALPDLALAALVFAENGRTEPARRLLAAIAPDASPAERFLSVDLLLAVGDRGDALDELRALAETDEPAGSVALCRLVETLRLDDGAETAERDAVLVRLSAVPGAANTALLYRGRDLLMAGDRGEAVAIADRLLEANPVDPSALELRLLALLSTGAPADVCVTAAETLLGILPGHPTARLVKARGLLARVRAGGFGPAPERSAAALGEAVDLAPGDLATRLARGLVEANLGNLKTAEADALALMEGGENPGLGEYLLGVVRFQQSRLTESAELFRRADRATPDTDHALLALGQVLLALRSPEEALDVADEIRRRVGPDPAMPVRAGALLALGRPDEAVELVRVLADREDCPTPLLLLRARVFDVTGRAEDATLAWEALVEKHPDVLGFRTGHVRALLLEERPADALAAAERAAARGASGIDGRLLLALTRRSTGDSEGALADLRRVVRDAPDSPLACRVLGLGLLEEGRTEEGSEFLRRAAALDPREVPARLRLAMLAEAGEREEEAVALYEEILSVAPAEVLAANNLAFRLARKAGQTARAVELARRAVARFPEEGEFRDTLAMALSAAGDHEAAVDEAAKAVELAATSPWVAIRAAEVYRDAGMPDRAREAAATAELRAEPAEVDEIRRRIRNLLATLPRK